MFKRQGSKWGTHESYGGDTKHSLELKHYSSLSEVKEILITRLRNKNIQQFIWVSNHQELVVSSVRN